MIKYQVTVPMAHVIEARRICATLKDRITALREQLTALDEIDPVRDGIAARDRAQAEKQRIIADIETAKTEAIDAIRERKREFMAEVDRQEALKGEDLVTAPDYALLRDGLINDANQLQMMADRNMANYTMLVAIDHYATEKEWTGFAVISNAPMVKTFGENWFKMCEMAAGNIDGLAIFQIQTEGELRRMLQEYGVLDAAELPDEEG